MDFYPQNLHIIINHLGKSSLKVLLRNVSFKVLIVIESSQLGDGQFCEFRPFLQRSLAWLVLYRKKPSLTNIRLPNCIAVQMRERRRRQGRFIWLGNIRSGHEMFFFSFFSFLGGVHKRRGQWGGGKGSKFVQNLPTDSYKKNCRHGWMGCQTQEKKCQRLLWTVPYLTI